MNITELTRIDRTIEVAAPRERVWRALTDARELSAWLQVKIDGRIAPNEEVWMTPILPEHGNQPFKVHFVELNAPSLLVWEWHPGEVDPKVDYSKEPRTRVTFVLEEAGKRTRVTVSETGFDEISLARRAKVYADNNQGWAEVIAWLQKYVETSR